jgi:hypothetical protein
VLQVLFGATVASYVDWAPGDSQFEGVREKAGEQLMTGCGRSMDSRVRQAN